MVWRSSPQSNREAMSWREAVDVAPNHAPLLLRTRPSRPKTAGSTHSSTITVRPLAEVISMTGSPGEATD